MSNEKYKRPIAFAAGMIINLEKLPGTGTASAFTMEIKNISKENISEEEARIKVQSVFEKLYYNNA